jgi:hypothetical protein
MNRVQELRMPRLNTERTFVLRLYKVSNGDVMSAVTEVATGERWVAQTTPELERLLRFPGHDGIRDRQHPV